MKTNYFYILAITALLFLQTSCSPDSTETEPEKKLEIITTYNYTIAENELVSEINNYRAAKGLNKLVIVNHISNKSQEHNLYMIQNNVVNHDLFDQRSSNIIQTLGAIKVAENIGYNFQNAQGVLNAWLQSPGHKYNLDGDFTHVGISITINPSNGKKYYTNMFMKK